MTPDTLPLKRIRRLGTGTEIWENMAEGICDSDSKAVEREET